MRAKGILAAVLAVVSISAGSPGAFASNDPLFGEQWALQKIQAEPAWGLSRGKGVKVAVVDTGVDFNHEDLAGKAAGSFFCIKDAPIEVPCDPAPPVDDNGHGTQVAGVIAALEGNGKGIAPVAPDASLMSFKALGGDGSGNLSDVIRALRSAADQGADVINLSLGPEVNLINDLLNLLLGADPKAEFRDAFKYAAEKGAFVVAAAGNSGTSSFFAGLENVYVVGSTGPADEVAFYSSSGAEIFAPGGNSSSGCTTAQCINTTAPSGYKAVQGTSFAAPHVSGVAALVLGKGLGPSEARARINETADPIAGGKRVNALRAVSGATGALAVPAPPAAPAPPKPPAAPPPAPPPPAPVLPPVQNLLPILLLSSSQAQERPPQAIAARTPEPGGGTPWVPLLALTLSGITALGHAHYQFRMKKVI